jgi:hypothetical protein
MEISSRNGSDDPSRKRPRTADACPCRDREDDENEQRHQESWIESQESIELVHTQLDPMLYPAFSSAETHDAARNDEIEV